MADDGGGGLTAPITCGGGSEVVSARELIVHETLQEVELALAASRPCTYFTCVPELAAEYGVRGIMQPVYACRTCADFGGHPVGVCEPCMLACHSDHDVVEVGNRRTFRCDCPTIRSSVPCNCIPPGHLAGATGGGDAGAGSTGVARGASDTPSAGPAVPLDANTDNVYGHNFEGRWCSCDGEYDAGRDEMIQCVACDEWYHAHHVPGKLPSSLECDTLVCAACVGRLPFLRVFSAYTPGRCTRQPSHAHPSAAMVATPAVTPGTTVDATASPSAPAPGGMLRLQPWRTCFTCTEGADDGRGVCMACATTCHAGHVLGPPRITEFYCDCEELLAARRSAAAAAGHDIGALRASCACLPAPITNPKPATATPSSPTSGGESVDGGTPSMLGVKRSRAVLEGAEVGVATTPAPQAATPSSPAEATWCAARADADGHGDEEDGGMQHVSAPMLLNDDGDLLARLCRCQACMRGYVAKRVATWFFDVPGETGVGGTPAGGVASSGSGVATPGPPASMAAPGMDGGGGGEAGYVGAAEVGAHRQAAIRNALAGGLGGKHLAAVIPGLPSTFTTTYEQAMSALQGMPHTAQLNALHGYNELSSELLPFLRSFADEGRVVTEADVKAFFAKLATGRRGRPRMDDDGSGP